MRVRATASVVLMVAGFVFGAIIIMWQLIPLFFVKPLEATWTDEATYFDGNYTIKIFMAANPKAAETSARWAYGFAEEIANQTDHIVHVIDVRVGMAMVWWELSHNPDPMTGVFPGRWTWDRLPREVWEEYREAAPVAAYDRLKEVEQLAVDMFDFPDGWLPVDWSFEAVLYYYNPGEPFYDVPDKPDMQDVLRREAGGYTEEFRAMFANATIKAEEIAEADDKVVDLQDLREAIAITLQQQYPDKYPTLADARLRLEELEATVGLTAGT
jgi:hypothetical protein